MELKIGEPVVGVDFIDMKDLIDYSMETVGKIQKKESRNAIAFVGSPKSGKTSLLHELSRRISKKYRNIKVIFVSGDWISNELDFIDYLRLELGAEKKSFFTWKEYGDYIFDCMEKTDIILLLIDNIDILSYRNEELISYLRTKYQETDNLGLIVTSSTRNIDKLFKFDKAFYGQMVIKMIEPLKNDEAMNLVNGLVGRNLRKNLKMRILKIAENEPFFIKLLCYPFLTGKVTKEEEFEEKLKQSLLHFAPYFEELLRGFSSQQRAVIMALSDTDISTTSEIAKKTKIAPKNATTQLSRLAKAKIVRKTKKGYQLKPIIMEWLRKKMEVEERIRRETMEIARGYYQPAIAMQTGEAAIEDKTFLRLSNLPAEEISSKVKMYERRIKESKNKKDILKNRHELGVLLALKGELDRALKEFNQILRLSKEIKVNELVEVTLHNIANIYYIKGDYDKAIEYYHRSLKICEELGDKDGYAITLHQIGMIHQDQGDYEGALSKYEESMEIKEGLGDKRGVANTLHQIGSIYFQQRNYEEALENYEKSMKISKDLGYKIGIAGSLHQIGMIHHYEGDYKEALEKYEKSMKIFEKLGDKMGIGYTLHQIGNIHYQQGNYNVALEKYEESMRISEELGDKSGIALTLGQLGNVALERGDYEEAFRYFSIAATIFDELKSPHIESTLINIAIVRDELGDKKFEKLVKVVKKELEKKKKIV